MASPHQRRKLMSMGNRPSFSRETKLQWAGSRERISPSGRGGAFFLTSLFIELIDPVVAANARLHQLSRSGFNFDWSADPDQFPDFVHLFIRDRDASVRPVMQNVCL